MQNRERAINLVQSSTRLRAMQWLDRERRARGLTLNTIAKQLGHRGPSGLSHYLHGRARAGPGMMRRIASIVGVSVIEALWRAGHHAAMLDEIAALYDAGRSQTAEDGLLQPRSVERCLKSYYLDRVGSAPEGIELSHAPSKPAGRYCRVEHMVRPGDRVTLWVAAPILRATLLAVGLFPRRGEKLREKGALTLRDLLTARTAEGREGCVARSPELTRPLEAAQRLLHERDFIGTMQRALVAEYVHGWCNYAAPVCAMHARAVLYDDSDMKDRLIEHLHAGLGQLYGLN